MTRTKSINSILVATLLLATFATTSITMPAFAQQAPTPNQQGQQYAQQQSQSVQGQQYAQQQSQSVQGQQYAQQQSQQVTPYSAQSSIQSIITQQQLSTLPLVNQRAVDNSADRANQFNQQDGLVPISLQLGNTEIVKNVAVAIPVAANICNVNVLGTSEDPTSCEAQTPGNQQ